MDNQTEYARRLQGWDVVSLLLGGVALATVQSRQPAWFGAAVLWSIILGPVPLFIRRRFFPQLDPTAPLPSEAPPLRLVRVMGYAMMVFGGFVMIFTTIFLCLEMAERAVLPMAIGVAVFAAAGLLASAGFRWVG